MWSTLLSVVLVINELMASNAGVEISPAINFDSWIEVYNPSDQAVNLGGMYLSDDANNLKKWHMPSDMGKVPAKGFKVIWLGSADRYSSSGTIPPVPADSICYLPKDTCVHDCNPTAYNQTYDTSEGVLLQTLLYLCNQGM